LTLLALAVVALRLFGAARGITLAALALFVALLFVALPRNYYAAVTEQAYPYETNVHKTGPGAAEGKLYVMKRWLEWAPALRELSAHPALGVGVNNYQATSPIITA